MTKSEALARIYETYSVEQLLNAKDEPDADTIESFLGVDGFRVDTYADVQREFGWDDTH
jgi:hypothetical protein